MMYLDGWINSEGRALVKEKKNKNDIIYVFSGVDSEADTTKQNKRNERKECVCAFAKEQLCMSQLQTVYSLQTVFQGL